MNTEKFKEILYILQTPLLLILVGHLIFVKQIKKNQFPSAIAIIIF
jgi:hypothetical protein